MGMNNPPENCHVTDEKTTDFPSSYDLTEYTVIYANQQLFFRFHYDHKNSEFVEANKNILQGLILNNKFPKEYHKKDGPILDNQKLEHIINQSILPNSPEEKMNNLLSYLHSRQEFEGAIIEFSESEELLAKKLYFKNFEELNFYLFTLYNKGFITGIISSTKQGRQLGEIQLTYEGLSRVIEILEDGNLSKRCFIAMSFSEELRETRAAIKSAVENTGFQPILIDEIHYDADVTINDALIAEIKKCKFLVADFTQHKHGVYFEAGFALGLKRPVIYLCKENEFGDTHFDTNHYPHIIYSDLKNLKENLGTKIEAWIN
jgi:hypothetical protein